MSAGLLLIALTLAEPPPASPMPRPPPGAIRPPPRNLPKRPPPAPPSRLTLPPDAAHPLLSNPQLTVDGSTVYVARLDAPAGSLRNGIPIAVISLVHKPTTTIEMPAPVIGDDVQLLLSPNEQKIATVSAGELWIKAVDGKSEAKRLYPPPEGDAPLGPRLSHAAFSRDSSWILLQTPLGWGRVGVETGEFGSLPLHPIDLTIGAMVMDPESRHVVLVKPQRGNGYLNGANLLAISLETGFAQVLDKEHLYTSLLFLPDGKPVGVDVDGALWVVQNQKRQPYFTPPADKGLGHPSGYAVDLGLDHLAWVETSGLDTAAPKAELWIAGAPPPPKLPKRDEH